MNIKIQSAILLCSMCVAESVNILAIFPVHAKSHYSINQAILNGLLSRGHNITVFSFFKSSKTIQNYKEILIGTSEYQYSDSVTIDEAHTLTGLLNTINLDKELETSACHQVFKLSDIKKILESKEKLFDLMIAESHGTHCYHLLAYALNIPLIFLYPPSISAILDLMIGNPGNPAIVPLLINAYSTHMNFFERASNAVQYVTLYALYNFRINDDMADISKQYLQMELPSVETLHRQVALIFYNNHFSFINRALVPNAIEIGGIHIREPNPLPQVREHK